jgi:hypothetical protein
MRPGTCPVDDNTALVLADPAQRERMVELTWGTPAHRDNLRKSTSQRLDARRTLTGGVTFAMMTGAIYIGTGEGLISLASGAIMGLFSGVFAAARPLVLIPGSAPAMPSWPRIGTGRIVHADELVAPGSGTPCAAWAVELRYDGPWGTRTIFRAAASLGLDIVMDGGDHVRIPAGALWLDGNFIQLDGEHASIDELLREVDPLGADSDWQLFPFNIIREQLLDEGDRVEVLGVVEPRPAHADDPRLYRDAPAIELVHTGVPVLRRA